MGGWCWSGKALFKRWGGNNRRPPGWGGLGWGGCRRAGPGWGAGSRPAEPVQACLAAETPGGPHPTHPPPPPYSPLWWPSQDKHMCHFSTSVTLRRRKGNSLLLVTGVDPRLDLCVQLDLLDLWCLRNRSQIAGVVGSLLVLAYFPIHTPTLAPSGKRICKSAHRCPTKQPRWVKYDSHISWIYSVTG